MATIKVHNRVHSLAPFLSFLLLFILPSFVSCRGSDSSDDLSDERVTDTPQASGITRFDEAFSAWSNNMRTFGEKFCNNLNAVSTNSEQALADTYYDAASVFLKISDFQKNDRWLDCADRAASAYASYVERSGGNVPGYWNFTNGLTGLANRFGKGNFRDTVLNLASNAAYASNATDTNSLNSSNLSREVAYAMISFMNAEDLGRDRDSKLDLYANLSLSYIDSWFKRQDAEYVRPFMVGLTAYALIRYHQKTGDARIIPALIVVADSLWNDFWVEESNAFRYSDRCADENCTNPAPDLNLLIAPLYSWLWNKTGNRSFLNRGDQIFIGGINGAFLSNNPKIFNQNYFLSFDFIQWRG
jgi:hypothetical protein